HRPVRVIEVAADTTDGGGNGARAGQRVGGSAGDNGGPAGRGGERAVPQGRLHDAAVDAHPLGLRILRYEGVVDARRQLEYGRGHAPRQLDQERPRWREGVRVEDPATAGVAPRRIAEDRVYIRQV